MTLLAPSLSSYSTVLIEVRWSVSADLVSIGLAEDVLDSLVNGVDGVCVLVGDLNAEFLLDSHHNLNGIQAVQAEVVREVCRRLDVARIADLVKPSQQAHDPALNVLLRQARTGSIAPHGIPAGDARDERRDGGLVDKGGPRDDGGEGPGRGSPCGDGGGGSEDGGAEHLGEI